MYCGYNKEESYRSNLNIRVVSEIYLLKRTNVQSVFAVSSNHSD